MRFSAFQPSDALLYCSVLTRSYAAMGREFPFPVDVRLDPNPVVGTSAPGQASLEHMEAAFLLLRKQQEVLKALVEDRRVLDNLQTLISALIS